VNLACKATLGAITDLTYADDGESAEHDVPPGQGKDCIVTVRSLITGVMF
jgi:hypothetical protein